MRTKSILLFGCVLCVLFVNSTVLADYDPPYLYAPHIARLMREIQARNVYLQKLGLKGNPENIYYETWPPASGQTTPPYPDNNWYVDHLTNNPESIGSIILLVKDRIECLGYSSHQQYQVVIL